MAFPFVTLGDVGLDAYSDEAAPRPGGCALNVGCALATAGARGVATAGPVGPDGAWLASFLEARGVTSLIEVKEGRSPSQRIAVREDGERDFSGGYAPGVLAGWRPGPAAEEAARGAGLLYVPTFDVTRPLAELAFGWRGRRPLAIDVMNASDHDAAFLAEVVRRATVVFAGFDAARDGARIEHLAACARAPGAALVVVTLGPRGALALEGATRLSVPAAPVPGGRVVDTTGCGDAFAGGFLAARARGEPVEAAMAAASRQAARVASWRGAVAPLG